MYSDKELQRVIYGNYTEKLRKVLYCAGLA